MKFDNFHIAVISHHRPDNVEKMEEITGVGEHLNWYLGKKEKKDYAHAKGNLYEAGSLLQARNAVLRRAQKEGKYCIQLDDDLVKISQFQNKQNENEITFKQMLKEMYDVLRNTPLYLAGVAPTVNRFYFDPNKPIGLKHFIIASCFMVKPDSKLKFDEKLRTKEDYDYTLQHIQKYGGVVRLNYLAPKFLHYGNAGGVVEYRTSEVEQASIKHLMMKWGDSIRLNKKRPNEILLRVK